MNRAARLCKGGSEQAASGGASAAWGCSTVQESRLLWGAPAAWGCSIVQESILLWGAPASCCAELLDRAREEAVSGELSR